MIEFCRRFDFCGHGYRSLWAISAQLLKDRVWDDNRFHLSYVCFNRHRRLSRKPVTSRHPMLSSVFPSPFSILFILWHLYLFYTSDSWLQFIFSISSVFSLKYMSLSGRIFVPFGPFPKKKQKNRSTSTMCSISFAYGLSSVYKLPVELSLYLFGPLDYWNPSCNGTHVTVFSFKKF